MTDPQDPFAPPPAGQEPPANPYGQPPAPPQGGPQPPPYGAPPYGAPQYGAPQYGAPQYGAPLGGPAGGPRKNGMGVAALVLGIASVIPCFYLLVLPAVLGIVFGVQGRKRAKVGQATNGGVATAGLVTGIVGLVFSGLLYAFLIPNFAHFRDWVDCVDASAGDSVSEQACNDQLSRDLGVE